MFHWLHQYCTVVFRLGHVECGAYTFYKNQLLTGTEGSELSVIREVSASQNITNVGEGGREVLEKEEERYGRRWKRGMGEGQREVW